MLKPTGFAAEASWRSSVLAALPTDNRFRVARPVAARDGRWVVDGWEATELVAGRTDTGRADDAIRAGIAFHEALATIPRPAFLDVRDDPWTRGDHAAWGGPAACSATAARLLEPLLAARRPVDVPAQVVHGDLGGNVRYADGLPPAVIDWVVYHRPPSWAAAVVVADALCWYGAGPDLVARWTHLPEFGQMLVRAFVYRIVAHDVLGKEWSPEVLATHRWATVAALAGAASGRR